MYRINKQCISYKCVRFQRIKICKGNTRWEAEIKIMQLQAKKWNSYQKQERNIVLEGTNSAKYLTPDYEKINPRGCCLAPRSGILCYSSLSRLMHIFFHPRVQQYALLSSKIDLETIN